jgi:diguanylate cyclase (GGDEF)-like protein
VILLYPDKIQTKSSQAMTLSDIQLAELFLFSGVDLDSVRHLINGFEVRQFPNGKLLFDPETINSCMYVILEGSASVHLSSVDSDPIAQIKKGESIGEMSALDEGITPSAYVKAESNMIALVIDHQTLIQLINLSHELSRNLLVLLSKRLRSVNTTVTHSKQLQEEFEQNANIDALTGLFNRRWIDDYFDRMLRRAKQQDDNNDFAILLADVDHFKTFNDRYGHLAGDQALRCVANALRENTRPTDIVSRYGGEEFLMILPNTNPQMARSVAERIVTGMREQPIIMGETRFPNITISVGIASLEADDSFETLVEAADKGLFKAKESGRNQVAINRVKSAATV